jgi:hypothetical protein
MFRGCALLLVAMLPSLAFRRFARTHKLGAYFTKLVPNVTGKQLPEITVSQLAR